MVIDTLISLGIMGILLFIAIKAEVINDMTHEIRNILIGRKPPLSPSIWSSKWIDGATDG